MKHYGDITKISGYHVPPVNVVIGGSPCQDLSVAGKRAGLAGERSGLFMEQIRLIKEMRLADEQRGNSVGGVRPRFMVWENVPGAFSSNRGADFGAVLQETIRVIEPEAPDVPVPDGGWPMAGCLFGANGGWSIAWRVLDAQFWGVPQRAVASRLSQILEANAPQKYYLSAKACLGIIRRAERRGKELPPTLREALMAQSKAVSDA